MNELHKITRKITVAGIAFFALLFGTFSIPCLAFGSNWESSGAYKSLGYYQGQTYSNPSASSSGTKYYRAISATLGSDSNTYPEAGTVGVLVWTKKTFKERGDINLGSNTGSGLSLLFYSLSSGYYGNVSYSTNNLTWTTSYSQALSNTRTATDQNGEGSLIYYKNDLAYYSLNRSGTWSANPTFIDTFRQVFPNIPIIYGCDNVTDIIDVISLDKDLRYAPWTVSTSSGGMHFSDGTELDDSNTAVYNNVFTVMDINQDNSISEEEVNYYNVTYDTNYDYHTVNNVDDFDLYDFLYYVAVKLGNGENPAGDGSGGGSQDTTPGAGVTVGDIQQQQQQQMYQTIEENAVNVTITNENGVNQSNSQYFDQVINNNLGTSGNTFEQAIGTISGFTSIARSFAGLASVVLGFLPGWVLALLAVTFSLLFVMIVFRLIHLFL